MCKQHIPNPEAQFPEAVPPEFVHSSAVLQIPLKDDEEVVIHSSFGKETTENSEKDPTNRVKVQGVYCLLWKVYS